MAFANRSGRWQRADVKIGKIKTVVVDNFGLNGSAVTLVGESGDSRITLAPAETMRIELDDN